MELENIDAHLEKMTKKEWVKLFDLIPEIEGCKNFVESGGLEEDKDNLDSFIITPVIEAKVVLDFEDIIYELELDIPFNWPGWDEGREIVKKGKYSNLDTITLLKLLTAFIRNNRFCDGALAARFEDGTIGKILKEIKRNIEVE